MLNDMRSGIQFRRPRAWWFALTRYRARISVARAMASEDKHPMNMRERSGVALLPKSRRAFIRLLAMLGVGFQAFARSGDVMGAITEARTKTDDWPEMPHRKLGRTNFDASRLIFGCGAALSQGQAVSLLDIAFEAGINVFDVGGRRYYQDAEKYLAPFLKKTRDRVFLISKSKLYHGLDPEDAITVAQAKEGAQTWLAQMDESLRELRVENIDAYYIMGENNPAMVRSDEMYEAFLTAKRAGKVEFFGVSTHENAQNVLEAATETGRYDLAQIAITPAGWYDWNSRSMLPGTPDMVTLAPVLARAREAGIGLVGMKAGRYLAGRRWLGWGNPDAYDHLYDENLMSAPLSSFQRSYAYVLEHGLDAVNADMQTYEHLAENFVAAATSREYFS